MFLGDFWADFKKFCDPFGDGANYDCVVTELSFYLSSRFSHRDFGIALRSSFYYLRLSVIVFGKKLFSGSWTFIN